MSGYIFDRMNRIYGMWRTTCILSILFIHSINSGDVIPGFENISHNSDVTHTMLKRTKKVSVILAAYNGAAQFQNPVILMYGGVRIHRGAHSPPMELSACYAHNACRSQRGAELLSLALWAFIPLRPPRSLRLVFHCIYFVNMWCKLIWVSAKIFSSQSMAHNC